MTTSNYSRVEHIIKEYSIDPQRMWNLNETRGTLGKDTDTDSRSRRYLKRSSHKNCQILE